MVPELLEVVDSAYRLRGSDETWMTNVLGSMKPHLDEGYGLVATLIDARAKPSLDVERVLSVGVDPESLIEMQKMIGALQGPNERVRRIFALPDGCGTASEVFGELFASIPHFNHLAKRSRVRDFFGLVALDPGGSGCVINAPLSERITTSQETRRRWGRVNAHIAAAMRLRRAVPALASAIAGELVEDSTLEAVFDASGRVKHAEGEAKLKEARDALRDGVRKRERARGSLRRLRPDEALSEWAALINGRWSLLDHVDSDGRRVILARRNYAHPSPVPVLTHKQAQAVGCALLGHSNKLIAYELGFHESAIAMRIKRACTKLGVRTRVQLIAKLRGGYG